MPCRKVFTSLTMVSLLALTAVGAPPKTQPKTNTPPQGGNPASNTADQRTYWRSGDHFLATCVAIANQEEIAISRFAEKKLSDGDVKKFAQMLIDDHTEFLSKLQQFAPEATQQGFLAERAPGGERAAAPPPQRTPQAQATNPQRANPQTNPQRTNPAANAPATNPNATQRTAAKPNLEQDNLPFDLLQLDREMAEQCLANAEDKLSQEKGKQLDECFVGMQIGMHAAMKSKLEVFERHATGELKNVLAQGLKTTASHLKRAEELMDDLRSSSRSSDKSESN